MTTDSSEAPPATPPLERSSPPPAGPVILFDGVCNLCNAAVQWVIRKDRRERFRFASLQSEYARRALADAAPGQTLPDSVVLLDKGKALTRSDAAIGIARRLGFPYPLAVLALVIPRPIRDAVYSWVARNRYRWFGRQNACIVPTPSLRSRFLDAAEPRPVVDPAATETPSALADEAPGRARTTLSTAAGQTARRIGIAYLFLYMLPFPLGSIPGIAAWGMQYEDAKQQGIAWLSKAVGGPELTIFPAGSGDTTYNYVELLVYAIAALLVGTLWSALARFRPVSLRLRDLFAVMLRFYLGMTLIGYGWVKVFPLQMPAPGPHNALTAYADSSPMGILWRFIGASPAYQAFAGLGEVIAGTLLLFRRTTPLGAFIGAGVLLNVVMLNFCYDVPVKLFSSHLLLCSMVILWPQMVRLLSVLLFNLPTQPVELHPFPPRRRLVRWPLGVVKFVAILVFAVSPAVGAFMQHQALESEAAQPSLRGMYKVESFTRDGVEGRANEDDVRWVRFGFGVWGIWAIQHADISHVRYMTQVDMQAGTIQINLRPPAGESAPPPSQTLTFTRPEPDLLRIEGMLNDVHIVVLARKQENEGLLMSRGFHWINEFPFNR